MSLGKRVWTKTARAVTPRLIALAATAILPVALGISPAAAQEPLPFPGPLVAGVTPFENALDGIVVDKEAALVLGKSLFFDEQVGSDGVACASCHFFAGADDRLTNQLSPGLKDLRFGPEGDHKFGSERSDTGEVAVGDMPSGHKAKPNYTLTEADMPLHKLYDEKNRNSLIVTTTNDRVSSSGSFDNQFRKVNRRGDPDDRCKDVSDDTFYVTLTHQRSRKHHRRHHHHDKRIPARQVEPRHTPSVVNAAYFQRQFWDVRANEMFNGVGVFGMRDIKADPTKRLILRDADGKPMPHYLTLSHASLASQAVAPPLSGPEMSCEGRGFADVGRKMVGRRPLALQRVSRKDSVLGHFARRHHKGLKIDSYAELIKKAFHPDYWALKGRFKIVDDNGEPKIVHSRKGFTQMETNFSAFWGISIMLFESTLISSQTPFHAQGVIAGRRSNNCADVPLGQEDPLWARGCDLFFGSAGCSTCHGETDQRIADRNARPSLVLSEASQFEGKPVGIFFQVPKHVTNSPNSASVHRHDAGIQSIGLRPPFTDLLAGATDDYGNPLSFTRQYQRFLVAAGGSITECDATAGVCPPLTAQQQAALEENIHDPVLKRAILAFTGQIVPDEYDSPLVAVAVGGTPKNEPAKGGGADGNNLAMGADGAGKSPILINIGLNPPYFSWGGYPNLRQVMKFYNRGGNRRDFDATKVVDPAFEAAEAGVASCTTGDDMGSGPIGDTPLEDLNNGNVTDCDTNATDAVSELDLVDCDPNPDNSVDPRCGDLGYTPENDDLAAMVRFLLSLSDERVQCNMAPFDGPEQHILNGHKAKDEDKDGLADDIVSVIPASGADGFPKGSKLCIPNSGDIFAEGMQGRLEYNRQGDPHWYGHRKGHKPGSHKD